MNVDKIAFSLQVFLGEKILEVGAESHGLQNSSRLYLLVDDIFCIISSILYSFHVPRCKIPLKQSYFKVFVEQCSQREYLPNVQVIRGGSGMGKTQYILREAANLHA
jgi:hypothetical protein